MFSMKLMTLEKGTKILISNLFNYQFCISMDFCSKPENLRNGRVFKHFISFKKLVGICNRN